MASYAVRSFENGDLQRLVEIEAASTAMLAAHGCPQLFQEEPSTPRRSCFGCLPIRLLRRCCQGRNHRRICLGARTGRHFLARRNGCPKFARRGVGLLLLAQMVRIARRYNHAAIGLTTFADVPFNAPFYSRRRFLIADSATVEPVFTEQLERQNPEGCPLSDRVLMFRRL